MTTATIAAPSSLVEFLRGSSVLIADPSPALGHELGQLIERLGVGPTQIYWVSDALGVRAEIQRRRPKIILCDEVVGDERASAVCQAQRAILGGATEGLFVLLSTDSSHLTVSQAAELEFDFLLLKPFAASYVQQSLLTLTQTRTECLELLQEIERGAAFLKSGDRTSATRLFLDLNRAQTRSPLVYSHLGQEALDSGHSARAIAYFREGLSLQPLHLRSLRGLLQGLLVAQDWEGAYPVARKLAFNFPVNAERLTELLRLALITKNYADIERYAQLFLAIKAGPNHALNHALAAALLVTAKMFLRSGNQPQALRLFQQAADAQNDQPKLLREIIHALYDAKLYENANSYLELLAQHSSQSSDYRVMHYLLINQKLPRTQSILHGRQLLANGVQDPEIYEILIRHYMERGDSFEAQILAIQAGEYWPKRKGEFLDLTKEDIVPS